jgi:hypothetical protein
MDPAARLWSRGAVRRDKPSREIRVRPRMGRADQELSLATFSPFF